MLGSSVQLIPDGQSQSHIPHSQHSTDCIKHGFSLLFLKSNCVAQRCCPALSPDSTLLPCNPKMGKEVELQPHMLPEVSELQTAAMPLILHNFKL